MEITRCSSCFLYAPKFNSHKLQWENLKNTAQKQKRNTLKLGMVGQDFKDLARLELLVVNAIDGGAEVETVVVEKPILRRFELFEGLPVPFGAMARDGGVNFAIHSTNAVSATLCLISLSDLQENRVTDQISLDPLTNKTGDVWHVFLKGDFKDMLYGYTFDGNFSPAAGHYYDASRILLDPYAKAVISRGGYGVLGADGDCWPQMACMIPSPDDEFDWEGDLPLKHPQRDLIIYEMHVRGFTRHESSKTEFPGTYLGVVEKLDHLKELGVNCIELMPCHEFNELEYFGYNSVLGDYKMNFWGYSTVNFFSPMIRYSSAGIRNCGRDAINEVKLFIREAHKRGIEVLMDVVFNHTAEGNENGPILSFRGVDNSVYYMVAPKGEFYNYSGCGNTFNCNHPIVRQFVLDCLRYWATEMHVDGFRFDLASILTRGSSLWDADNVYGNPIEGDLITTGTPLSSPPLIDMISNDSILRGVKRKTKLHLKFYKLHIYFAALKKKLGPYTMVTFKDVNTPKRNTLVISDDDEAGAKTTLNTFEPIIGKFAQKWKASVKPPALESWTKGNVLYSSHHLLDYTMQLMETGVESDVVLALVVFSLQHVFVNHEYWKYKVKHVRWKVTLKALEVVKECILSIPYSQKVGEVVKVILLRDSSIHNTLFRVICTTPQALEKCYVSRFYEPVEIEGLELAICSVLDILFTMLSKLSKDISSSVPVFHQSVLSSTAKPNPIVAAVISLISYFRNSAIQLASARVISLLFTLADFSQPYLFGNACFGLDDNQITDLQHSVNKILCEHSLQDEELFVAVVRLLTSAARYQPAFLLAMVAVKENMDGQQNNTGGEKESINKPSFLSLGSKKGSLIDILLQYVVRSDDLIDSNPRILLNMLNFLKALWQGAAQYADILEQLKNSGKFWKQLSNFILLIASIEAPQRENHIDNEALARAYKYQCQCSILELMAYDMFLEKKLLDAELLVNQAAESSKEKTGNALSTEKSKSANGHDLKDIVSSWCENSVLGNLMKSYASCEYDNEICIRAKVAVSLFSVHVMGKLATGDAGSLSVSLIEMIRITEKKLSSLPAFSELKTKYSQHGYSDGTEPNTLILSDLYYHLQGEFAGRKIAPGPFKELSQFLFESKLLQNYQHKYDGDLFPQAEDLNLFDTTRLKKDLGLDMWDHSKWKVSKAIAEEMLLCMEEANSMVLLSTSKLSALKALENLFAVSEEDSNKKKSETCEKLIVSSIDHICNCFRATLESITQILDPSEHILGFLEAQVELLLQLTRSVQKHLSLPVCILVLKTSGFGLKVLSDLNQSVSGVKTTMKILLMLLLSSVEFGYLNSHLGEGTDKKSVEVFAEVSNVNLALLPVLCNCSKTSEHCTLSLTAMDLILKGFSTPNTWFPIIQKHFQLQHVILKLQDKMSLDSVPIILKFLLTLARVRVGAEMLLTSGFFFSLRVLFADSVNDSSDKTGKPHNIWGLGLAVVTAMICSLGDTSSCIDIVDSVIPYFFLEKAFLISYYLNAPDFPSDDHDKKRARSQRSRTSLSALKETEQTLLLMCVLAKHWNSWAKAMKEMDSQLRERSIHLLAFISRGNQRVGESRAAPLLCPPILKEEFDCFKKPSFVNSRNGWFALSPLGCRSKPKVFTVLNKTNALVVTENSQTYFSDIIALQIYRIAFLVLKFLCLQAEGAAKRAEEVGFVDLAHFPELPMPDILHGLQDQAITIVTELCEANKAKQIEPEIQTICGLLLKIMEMSLHLELCVSQICGIRPVLGRVEDFSKSVKFLLKATEGQVFLKASVKSLKQIMGLVYPGLLHSDGFL